MKNIKKIFSVILAAVLIPALFVFLKAADNTATAQTKQDVKKVTAVDSLIQESGSQAVAASKLQISEAVPADTRAQAAAPKPGKDITPKIEDQNRVTAILELVGKVYRGESFQYSHDGIVFKNKENVLPAMPNGYYHEYTLLPDGKYPSSVTIGGKVYNMGQKLGKRGCERIIIGGGEKIYYTMDHYATFVELKMVY
mgnify:CR=1 FL=1